MSGWLCLQCGSLQGHFEASNPADFYVDRGGLQKIYCKWRSMINNCAVRQALNVQDSDMALLLSAMLGQPKVKASSGGNSERFLSLALASK